jgi:hypothetical protein
LTYQLLGWRQDADGTTAVDPHRDGDGNGMVGQRVEAAIPTATRLPSQVVRRLAETICAYPAMFEVARAERVADRRPLVQWLLAMSFSLE